MEKNAAPMMFVVVNETDECIMAQGGLFHSTNSRNQNIFVFLCAFSRKK